MGPNHSFFKHMFSKRFLDSEIAEKELGIWTIPMCPLPLHTHRSRGGSPGHPGTCLRLTSLSGHITGWQKRHLDPDRPPPSTTLRTPPPHTYTQTGETWEPPVQLKKPPQEYFLCFSFAHFPDDGLSRILAISTYNWLAESCFCCSGVL